MTVVDASDRRWKVRRRWLPWRRRVREVPDVPVDGSGLGDDPISAILGLFLLVLAIPAIVVALVLVAELLLLLALLPLVVVLRLVLPVPWTVELWTRPASRRFLGWHLEHEVPLRGWRPSADRMVAMRAEIERLPRGRRYVPDEVRERAPAEGTLRELRETWPVGPASAPRDADGTADDRVPGDAAPPASPGAEVASGSPYGTAPARVAGRSPAGDGGSTPTPNPFAQRDED